MPTGRRYPDDVRRLTHRSAGQELLVGRVVIHLQHADLVERKHQEDRSRNSNAD